MKKLLSIIAVAVMVLTLGFGTKDVQAADGASTSKVYRFVWSHYTGWEPYQFMQDSGIMKKWADKCGVKVEILLINDYVTSINQYTAGEAVGCAMTEMDALDMPAAGGVDSDALVMGDYSNGNDGVGSINVKTLKELEGCQFLIVKDSVSSYLLWRAIEINKVDGSKITEVNTSDANIGATFAAAASKGESKTACVTWNPILMQIRNLPKVNLLFDSSKIPGEIQDLMVVRHDAPEAVKKALVGAWYETMAIMAGQGKQTDEAIEAMAKFAGGTVAEFKAQLKTTFMYYKAADAVAFVESPEAKRIMRQVSRFCFDRGLLTNTKSADDIGVEFPDGTVQGDPKNVKLRYVSKYMKMSAEGKL